MAVASGPNPTAPATAPRSISPSPWAAAMGRTKPISPHPRPMSVHREATWGKPRGSLALLEPVGRELAPRRYTWVTVTERDGGEDPPPTGARLQEDRYGRTGDGYRDTGRRESPTFRGPGPRAGRAARHRGSRLRGADRGPDAGDSAAHRWARHHRGGAHRHRQDGRLRPANRRAPRRGRDADPGPDPRADARARHPGGRGDPCPRKISRPRLASDLRRSAVRAPVPRPGSGRAGRG